MCLRNKEDIENASMRSHERWIEGWDHVLHVRKMQTMVLMLVVEVKEVEMTEKVKSEEAEIVSHLHVCVYARFRNYPDPSLRARQLVHDLFRLRWVQGVG